MCHNSPHAQCDDLRAECTDTKYADKASMTYTIRIEIEPENRARCVKVKRSY